MAMPNRWTVRGLTSLYGGMAGLAKGLKLAIAGGDMSATDGPAVLSLTVVGHTTTMPLARAQAEAGWTVAVTGPLGAAAVALRERRAHRLLPPVRAGEAPHHTAAGRRGLPPADAPAA